MKHLANKLHHIITTLQDTPLSTQAIYHVEITAYRDKLVLSDQLDVELENIYRDDFRHEDYRKLEQSLNAINFHDIHVYFNVNFQEDIADNDYSYLDDSDSLGIYTDQYVQEDNNFAIDYTSNEKNFVHGHFGGVNTYSPLARIQILITKDNVIAYVCDEQPEFDELLQSSVTYHTELASLISLIQPIGYQLPTYQGLPRDDITNLHDYITNVTTTMQTTKYFEPFLSTAHHVTSEAYLFYSSDSRKPLQEALVFEHIGYDFHWNAYNYFESSTANLLPIIHSYKDNSWNIAMVDHKKELTGIATRTICDSNFKHQLPTYFYQHLIDSMDENLLLEPYTTLKLSLSRGLIETLDMQQRDIYGYNDKDEIVFVLSTEDEITLIHNVESFKDGLNNIITELTAVNHV